MRAAVCESFGKPLRLADLPVPEPSAGQVRIRVAACGVCHSDLHLVDGHFASRGTPLPIIPGHEVAGTVDALGEGVTGLLPGDRVGVAWMQHACGRCRACRSGAEMLCPEQKSTGVTVDGGYAEYVVANAPFVHRIPEGLEPAEAAPLLCAGITVFAPLRRAGNLAGRNVAVAGVGGLGHLAIRMAAAMGAHVTALLRGRGKEELARHLGAHEVIDTVREDAGKALLRLGGADVILLTGISAPLLPACVSGLAPNGTLVILAAIDEPVPIVPSVLMEGQKKIEGSLLGTREDMDTMLHFAADHRTLPVVETFPLERANEALARLRCGEVRLRAVLTP
jgi:D-arabinose 1-dehydrogenase-like Zn-dependent alcohol dehydrogenase